MIKIYCDGASRKDGRGGWGFVVYEDDREVVARKGGAFGTTSNAMELTAAIASLEWADANCLPEGTSLTVLSDSKYVVLGITEYMDTWLRAGWRTSGNKPLKNQDLWERLCALDCEVCPDWEWVKGHSGVIGNERADTLAGAGVPEVKSKRPAKPRERYNGLFRQRNAKCL